MRCACSVSPTPADGGGRAPSTTIARRRRSGQQFGIGCGNRGETATASPGRGSARRSAVPAGDLTAAYPADEAPGHEAEPDDGTSTSARPTPGSQTVDRALSLLRLIAGAPTGGLRLLDIAHSSGLDRATTYRLLNSLVAQNFAEQDGLTKRYTLGLEFFTLAAAASNRFDLAGKARIALKRLSATTGDTATHCLKAALNLVCMDVETGHFPIRTLPMDIGAHRPIGAGVAGIAYLAALSEAESDDILKRNARRLAKLPGQTPAAIGVAIDECRRLGYALGPDEPHGRIHGLAIALTSRSDRPLGTLCLNGIPERFSAERIPSLVALLRAEAKAMADAIGLMPNEERHRSQWEPARRRKGAP